MMNKDSLVPNRNGHCAFRSICSIFIVLPLLVTFYPDNNMAFAENVVDDMRDEEPSKGVIERAHSRISRSITGTAKWFDSFFYDERYEMEENRSRLRLRIDSFLEKYEHAEYDLNASLRLILPNTDKRLRMVVAGDPDIESDVVDITNVENLDQTGQDAGQDLSVGLSYYIIDNLRQNFSFGAGVFVEDSSPQLSVTARFKQLEDIGKWTARMIPELTWDTANGWSSSLTIDLDRPVTERLLFRLSSQGEWFEHEEGFYYTLAASVFHLIGKKSAFAYQWINNFQTEPHNNHLHQTAVVVKYRQNIWKDWLFFEIAPQIEWPDDKDYEAIPGILLRIETIYGHLG